MKKHANPDCEHCQSRHDSIFQGLCQHNDFALLNSKKICNTYKKGQIVFYEGNLPAGLYCLNKGKVKIFKTGKIGKEQIVRLASPGDILGYRSLISEDSYSASAEAIEDATICFIDKKSFFELVSHENDLPSRIMQLLSNELGEAENKIQSLAQKTVRERLAEVLLILDKKYGRAPENKECLNVVLSREDLANIVGTATETVIRLLSDLKDDRIISFEGKKIRLLNIEKIAAISGIDY